MFSLMSVKISSICEGSITEKLSNAFSHFWHAGFHRAMVGSWVHFGTGLAAVASAHWGPGACRPERANYREREPGAMRWTLRLGLRRANGYESVPFTSPLFVLPM